MLPDEVVAFLANVDIAAAESFLPAEESKQRGDVLKVTLKYFEDLTAAAKKKGTVVPKSKRTWISFEGLSDDTSKKTKGAEPERIQPRLLQFDERSGTVLNRQDVVEDEPSHKPEPNLHVPWDAWLKECATLELGAQEACASSVLAALHALHRQKDLPNTGIDILYEADRGMKCVVASEDLSPGAVCLPPCVPRNNKVLVKSEHPLRIRIDVNLKFLHSLEGGENTRSTGKDYAFYVNPELKLPTATEPSAELLLMGLAADWEWKGDESLHPFWAVRRLTPAQLASEPKSSRAAGFNVSLQTEQVSHVTVGKFKGTSWSKTHVVSIPVLTNLEHIKRGTELVLQADVAEKKEKIKKRTWKDSNAQEERDQARDQKQVAKLRDRNKDGSSQAAASVIEV